MYFSHSPYRAPVLLASVPQQRRQQTNFINKSIYNASEEAPTETRACEISEARRLLRRVFIEHSVSHGTALAPYQGAHLCTWVCLPHKMAPGFGNGPWKWLLSCAYSTRYRLEFFMWQLGCWEIHPRGCALIKDSGSGHFLHCFLWPLTSFLPVGVQLHYSSASRPPCHSQTTPRGPSHDSSDSWPAWPPETPPILSAGPVRMITGRVRVTFAPPKWRLCPWAFDGKSFSELTVSKHHVRKGQPCVSS